MATRGHPKLTVRFYREASGSEPVRDWLKSLPAGERREVGIDVKTVQFGWPLGMPVVDHIDRDIWEVRTRLANRLARVLFVLEGSEMVLLHGFIKKERTTPKPDLGSGPPAVEEATEQFMKRNLHIGSDFDDFLQEEGILDAVQAVAVKRVLAHQLEQGMKAKQLTKTAMARRMGTTRAQLDRLLDPDNPSATLATLVKAANAVGKRVKISLVNA
jgi:phage-related protein